MTDTYDPPNPRWTSGTGAASARDIPANALHRFLGGSPAAVFVRLFFISLIVGVFLMWLDIRPYEIFRAIERLFERLYNLGFDAIREVFEYVLAGAALVVPIWFVARLLSQRPAR
jgi:hypothetical protein